MRRQILITHKNCMDGYGVVLAVKYYDLLNNITNREIIYCQYGDSTPNIQNMQNADIIIGDFSFSKQILLSIKLSAHSLIVLDHHKTAEENLQDLDFCIFNMNKSGAVLVWEYLMPTVPVPPLLSYIQDRDIWTWKLPKSKEISAYLWVMDFKTLVKTKMSFIELNALLTLRDFTTISLKGSAILEAETQSIENIVAKKQNLPRISIAGFDNIICINTTTLISEIGNKLSENEPFIVMYFDTEDKRIFSLRSQKKGEDVSAIAKTFGGGGHAQAAGFNIPKPILGI